MTSEYWLVLTVAAAFLLLGIAGSPLAWVVLYHRRSRLEIEMDRKYQYLFVQLKELESRVERLQSAGSDDRRRQNPSVHRATTRADSPAETTHRLKSPWWRTPNGGAKQPGELSLIAVPSLEPAQSDRGVTVNGLKERLCRDLGTRRFGSNARTDGPSNRPARWPNRIDTRSAPPN